MWLDIKIFGTVPARLQLFAIIPVHVPVMMYWGRTMCSNFCPYPPHAQLVTARTCLNQFFLIPLRLEWKFEWWQDARAWKLSKIVYENSHLFRSLSGSPSLSVYFGCSCWCASRALFLHERDSRICWILETFWIADKDPVRLSIRDLLVDCILKISILRLNDF